MDLLDKLADNPLALVIGTTGFEVFAATAMALVQSFPEASITVGEIYYAKKKPAASGTTQRLVHELGAVHTSAIKTDIQRVGDVAGVNTVRLDYGVAKLSLSLDVDSRAAYAVGAVEAAEWLIGKPNGYYMPKDML